MVAKRHVTKRIDGRSKNGGARPGSGRPRGTNGDQGGPQSAMTKLTRRLASEIIEDGESPLHLMHENMMFWWKASTAIGNKLVKMISEYESGREADADLMREVSEVLRDFLQIREKAQACAVDAAPYFHPRLQSIAFKGKVDVDVKTILDGMTPQQAAEAYAESIKGAQ